MFLEALRITVLGFSQIFILGTIGYFLVKKNILGQEGLDSLSQLVIKITLPILIFCQLVKDFSFSKYPEWWLFPLLSISITIVGLVVGALLIIFLKNYKYKLQFLSLITFQNSGYLPLALVFALLPKDKLDTMFIYIFLFLLGFDLMLWSMGVYMLTFAKAKRFKFGSLFSPPIIAILLSFIFISLGLNKFIPDVLFKPLRMAGDCTLPLVMFVVGGNLAEIRLERIHKKAISLMLLAKLIILPFLGLVFIMKFKFPDLIGLLILMELAMPPAMSLPVITRYYQKEDSLIRQGIFFGHIISILTIPIFLSLYFARVVIK